MKRDDVLIIGGGIIGVSAAYFLARAGVSVTVIEKGEVGRGCSYGNAGLICPGHSTPISAPGVLTQGLKWLLDAESPFYIKPRLDLDLIRWLWWFQSHCNQSWFDTAVPLIRDLQRASLALFRELVKAEKLDCHFEQRGGLTVFLTERGFEHGRHEAAALQRFGLQMAVLDGAAIRELETAVHPNVIGGIHSQEDAHITPDLFVTGLAAAAQTYGATFLTQTELLGFEVGDGRVTAVPTTRGEMRADQIILAAGAWTAPIARDLGLKIPMQPAKGYSVTVKRPSHAPQMSLYLGEAKVAVTPMGPHLRFAGTLELAGFDFAINQRRVNAILRASVGYLADGYLTDSGERELVEIWRGLRPCTPDGLPYIGRTHRYDNLIVAAGHAMLGLSMGPMTGKLVAEVVAEERPSLDLAPFQVERFRI